MTQQTQTGPSYAALVERWLGLPDAAKAVFLEAMRCLLYDYEPETEEEIDAFLRSEGIDPEACGQRGRELARKFFAEDQGQGHV